MKIFCEMAFKYLDYTAFESRHVSPAQIGRKLGLDEKTVRARIKKMEDDGFIQYYEAVPNFLLLGMGSMGLYNFEATDVSSKHDALQQLRQARNIVEAFDLLGPSFSATLAGSSAQQVQEIADELTVRLKLKSSFRIADRAGSNPLSNPDKLDWQILRELRYDALSPAKEIAKKLSVTPRIVEYRISKLLESRVFFIRSLINAQKQQGLLFFGLVMITDEAKQAEVIQCLRESVHEKIWSIFVPTRDVVVVNLCGFSIGEPEEAVIAVTKLGGVRQCTLSLFKGTIEPERPNWVDAMIEDKIRE